VAEEALRERLADEGLWPAYASHAWGAALALVKDRRITACPHPVLAVLEQDKAGTWHLYLESLELDKDTEGILIIERDLLSGHTRLECYSLGMGPTDWPTTGPFLFRVMPRLPVQIRSPTNQGQAKDVAAWHRWKAKRDPRSWPPAPIWMSLPSKTRTVELAIYDRMGHIGGPIPVHNGRADLEKPGLHESP
jgi:hypothetical protein